MRARAAQLLSLFSCAALLACSSESDDEPTTQRLELVVATFNTGTNPGMPHDAVPDDGYGSEQAALSDQYYGDGLAWLAVIDDARRFFEQNPVDIIGFQEIFHSAECASVPAEARAGFVCESHQPGDPTVAQLVLGAQFQVACHVDNPDKCIGVRKSVGRLRGCNADLCLDGLDGAPVDGCGGGARVGRGVIELEAGGTLTVVNIHGTSGLTQEDQDCRVSQFSQVFVDLGDGEPAANGEKSLIVGDLNTDPGRHTDFDESAALFASHVGDDKSFHFVSDVGPDAEPTYAALFNIDHVASNALSGSCFTAGIGDEHPAVTTTVYFDHKPLICSVAEP